MSVYNTLDVMIKDLGMENYENNKRLVILHLEGKIPYMELPKDVQELIEDWTRIALEMKRF